MKTFLEFFHTQSLVKVLSSCGRKASGLEDATGNPNGCRRIHRQGAEESI